MVEVSAAHEENGAILVLLKNQKVLLISKDRKPGTPKAIELDPKWPIFNLDGDINQLIENVKRKAKLETINLINSNKYYQEQITNYLRDENLFNKIEKSNEAIIDDLLHLIHSKGAKKSDITLALENPIEIGTMSTEEILNCKDSTGKHLGHHLAVRGFLPLLPNRLTNATCILEKDDKDVSALEYHYLNYSFRDIPQKIWDIPEIAQCIEEKANITSWASRLGKEQELPKEFLSKEVLTHIVRENGQTPIHQLARDGKLNFIPKDLLGEEMMLTKDTLGKTIYHTLAESRNIIDISVLGKTRLPTEILDLKDNESRSVGFQIICNGGLKVVDQNYWTKERWEELNLHTPPLHMVSKNGELQYIPGEYVNPKAMLTFDRNGQTAYHQAIENGKLHKIPQSVISQRVLLTPNSTGVSSLTSLVNKGIGWGHKPLPSELKKDIIYALKFLDRKQLRELADSGISRVSELCEIEIKNRVIEKLHKRGNSLEI